MIVYLLPFLFLLGGCQHGTITPPPVSIPTGISSILPVDSSRLAGVTIDSIDPLPAILESLSKLPKRATVRIVFDVPNGPAYYKDAVTKISAVADILGQPADSTYVKRLSLTQYKQRFQNYVTAFPQIKFWEAMNEANGDWLGTGVPTKLDAAYDVIKAAGKKVVVTPYWNTQDCKDSNGYWLDWIKKNVSSKVKAGADYVLVSVYGGDCDGAEPTLADISAFYLTLGTLFPNALLGIGEMGGSESYSIPKREATISYYYKLPKLHPRDAGFFGYWFFASDAVPYTKSTWKVLSDSMK